MMVAAGGPAYLEVIEETNRELTKVIERFGRAVDIEVLRLANGSGKHSLPQYGDSAFSVALYNARVLLARLRSVKIGYHQDPRCMEGTRQVLLGQTIAWVTNKSAQKDERSIYWSFGLPEIGKRC